jgi:hypothetical protein
MTRHRAIRRFARPAAALILAPALLAMLVSAASIPHIHAGPAPGLFNQDHDLSSLAGLSGAALLPDVIATATLGPVASPLLGLAACRPAGAPERHADPRAPPLR